MATTNLKTLIGKLNDTCRRAAERAASLTMTRGHHEVDVEHLFLALLDEPRSDLARLAARADVATSALRADLDREVVQFRGGNTRTPVFSERLPVLLEHAWLIASLDNATARIR
ncbi:MAG: Clp protease N-terminal domain-containing protein, partial [Rubrivivax sp.]